MSDNNRWLLPEGIEEVLPERAKRLETMRRELIDLYHLWGYDQVIPPFIEYLESLFAGTGNILDLQTFKIIDQLSGRLMGVRADMTPQVARIDARQIRRDGPTRLCYVGTVLHTLPEGFAGSRAPMQVGAELYGQAGVEGDLEIIRIMIETLRRSGVVDFHIDLGHVGIFQGLMARAGLQADQEEALFDALQRKARTEIDQLLADLEMPADVKTQLAALIDLSGGVEVLAEARKVLAGNADALAALDELEAVGHQFASLDSEVELCFDLGEWRCYRYETGIVFAAYVPGCGQEVARGGRYDGIGKAFGRDRPAVGFSADLKTLVELGPDSAEQGVAAILAPAELDAQLEQMIDGLRAEGHRVVRASPDSALKPEQMGCSQQIVRSGDGWQLVG